ncbi:MAG: glycosyltransferase [Eubacteriales bacterium]
MLPISICIIAKDEADYLEECLKRLYPYGFELVVVDTGSRDATISVAAKYTDCVYSYVWCNDFSAARNYSIQQATNDWILIVDCDEHLTSIDVEALNSILQTLDPTNTIGQITLSSPFSLSNQESLHTSHLARFFSRTHFHYEGTIHEQVVSGSNGNHATKSSFAYPVLPLAFYHEGYGNPAIIATKSKRNIALLEQELETSTPTPYTYFQLGQSYFTLEKYQEALHYFQQGFEYDVNPAEEYVQTMVTSYGYCLLNLKRYDEGLLFMEQLYEEFNTYADFLFLMGLLAMNNGLFQDAIRQLQRATTCTYYSVEGANSYSAYYNIGVIYECSGQITLARQSYTQAGNYAPALVRLTQLPTNE